MLTHQHVVEALTIDFSTVRSFIMLACVCAVYHVP